MPPVSFPPGLAPLLNSPDSKCQGPGVEVSLVSLRTAGAGGGGSCLCKDSGFWVKWEAREVFSRSRMRPDLSLTRNSGGAVREPAGPCRGSREPGRRLQQYSRGERAGLT